MSTAHSQSALTVEEAAPREMPLLAKLLARYLDELREQLTDPRATGAPPDLSAYRAGTLRLPVLFRHQQQALGFALLERAATPCRDNVIAEFGVVECYRRHRVGSAALAAILARWPGSWRLHCHQRNVAAIAFWSGRAAPMRRAGAVVHFRVPARSDAPGHTRRQQIDDRRGT